MMVVLRNSMLLLTIRILRLAAAIDLLKEDAFDSCLLSSVKNLQGLDPTGNVLGHAELYRM